MKLYLFAVIALALTMQLIVRAERSKSQWKLVRVTAGSHLMRLREGLPVRFKLRNYLRSVDRLEAHVRASRMHVA